MRPTLWVGLVFNHMVLHFVNQENKVVLLVQMAQSSLRYMAHRSTWMEVERGSKQRSLQPSPFYWRGNVCQWLSLWIQCSAFITEFSPQPFGLLLPSAWYPHIRREIAAQAVMPIKPRLVNRWLERKSESLISSGKPVKDVILGQACNYGTPAAYYLYLLCVVG